MNQHYRVAVIGGGIVGCSVLYHLAEMGWRDIALIEQHQLTAGSTWHAAGNVTYFGPDAAIMRLCVDSIATYVSAEAASGQSISFHPTGSLRLATTPKEWTTYQRLQSLYRDLGIEYRVITPDEIKAVHPLVVTDGLLGAAHTPGDGHVDASGATHAMAKVARARGAKILQQTTVTAIAPVGARAGEWEISVEYGGEKDTIHAAHVVLANSFWTRELVLPLGLNLPLYPLEHHEIITDSVSELETLGFEMPTVRDPLAPSNIRQEGNGFLCGVYESEPQFCALDGIPSDFCKQLLPPDLERLQTHLLRVIERIPAFGSAGIKTVNNGPICYTPDGYPLLGPVAQYPSLWLATGFCVGIGGGGGSGKFLAGWMIEGEPEYHLPIVHPARFGNDLARAQCLDMIRQTYVRGYVVPCAETGADAP